MLEGAQPRREDFWWIPVVVFALVSSLLTFVARMHSAYELAYATACTFAATSGNSTKACPQDPRGWRLGYAASLPACVLTGALTSEPRQCWLWMTCHSLGLVGDRMPVLILDMLLQPVSIGDVVKFRADVVYTGSNESILMGGGHTGLSCIFQVRVETRIVDLKTGNDAVSNEFHFTFLNRDPESSNILQLKPIPVKVWLKSIYANSF
eukprot:766748-Hanusia_phi.AAC.15